EAIGETNLMTVTGVRIREVDVWQHIQQGYYYGRDHVVEATLTIETTWLRKWTVPFMPDAVRTLMKVQAPMEDG
ncbi:MAG: hypothetical protein KDA28_04535, partial [Phycisphaerales bacterium]|nr:hypothetical protein [Phycisphaerales bacterium]